MRRSILVIASFLVSAAPSIASAKSDEQTTFTYKNTTYTYSVEQKRNFRIIRGHTDRGDKYFVFRVTPTMVTGQFDQNPVSFEISEVRPNLLITEVASR